ncbi:MAG TPA: amino acid ABC transporter substrate-binding protein [Thermoanaerobaculia bacterium]|nr:amino acid ABC transporter substrate-binding protein [Thermoanaerobaculia bacterium]
MNARSARGLRRVLLLAAALTAGGALLVQLDPALETSLAVAEAPKAGAGEIAIGVVLPITGREAKPGQYQREGIELAIHQINQGGGILVKQRGKKLPIKEIFYDDGSDQSKSSGLVERAMTSDNVVAVLGGYSTALGEAESVMPDRYQTPWITTGAAASTIFSHGYQWIFGTLSPTDLLGYTTAEFLGSLVNAPPGKARLSKGLKLALALENTDHGVDYGKGIDKWIHEHPGAFSVVFSEKFDLGSPDFSGLLQKVKNAHADIFLADAHLQDYITMHRQYIQTGMVHQMISYGARGPESDARKALGDATNYIFAGIWWSAKLPYPQVKRFSADYQAFTGHPPDSWYPATAYDAVRALAAAIERAGSLDKTAIRNQLRTVELKDSLLPGQVLRFGKNGQINTPFLIVQNKPGDKSDIVFPHDAATGEAIAPKPH